MGMGNKVQQTGGCAMRELTHLSLFSGIGGLDLAAEWAGIRTVGQCEWAEYPARVLEKHWPGMPRWKDIRGLTKEAFYEKTGRRTVDVISGGFPCQPFSVAGKQRGKEDDRFLWPEMVRVIKELRPTWVVGENVAGIVRMELPNILSELEACGYRTRAFLIPACAVGARHRRYRVAIVGYADHNGPPAAPVSGGDGQAGGRVQEGEGEAVKPKGAGRPGGGSNVANAGSIREGGLHGRKKGEEPVPGCRSKDVQNTDSTGLEKFKTPGQPGREGFAGRGYHKDGCRKGGWRRAEPGLGGMADGIPKWVDGYWDIEPDIPRVAADRAHRADRVMCLGNAVVPQQFYPIFLAIVAAEIYKEWGEEICMSRWTYSSSCMG